MGERSYLWAEGMNVLCSGAGAGEGEAEEEMPVTWLRAEREGGWSILAKIVFFSEHRGRFLAIGRTRPWFV